MKHIHLSHIITGAIIWVSLYGCKIERETIVNAPMSAEINGVLYYNEGYRLFSRIGDATCELEDGQYTFNIYRFLQSDDNKEIYISIVLKADTIVANKNYECNCYLNTYSKSTGTLKFSSIENKNKHIGEFNFTSTDPDSGERYIVNNGKFVEYTDTHKVITKYYLR
jgi:hypothetical protein